MIREQWDQLVRLAASLKNRKAPANVIIQRLANSSPSDRLAKALTALGQQVVKTIYILRYIHGEEMRGRVQLQLNRAESIGMSWWAAVFSSPIVASSVPAIWTRS